MLETIKQITDIFGRYKSYTNGCLKFFLLMKKFYPEIEGYYNSEHVIFKHEGKFYDVDGEVKNLNNFKPFCHFGFLYFKNTFNSLTNYELQILASIF